MHLSQLQEKIGTWHLNTFQNPSGIMNLIAEKIDEESGEFIVAHDAKSKSAIAEELADTVIAILAYASRDGIDLESEILKKHCVNLKRAWKFNGKDFERER